MSRRIEIELTSRRDDGSWTWRAAGAKQPKGMLDGGLLPAGAAAGDVLRVDAEFEVDGIFITEVLPPKARSGKPPQERIELLGAPLRREVESDGQAGSNGGANRGAKNAKAGRTSDRKRKPKGDAKGGAKGGRKKGDDKRGERNRSPNADGAGKSGKGKADGKTPKSQDRRKKPGKSQEGSSGEDARPPRPKVPKLRPRRKHRDALIASLPAEEQVIAEQVAAGGLAAVRTEIEAQNRKAAEEGKPEVPSVGLLSLAESLVRPMQIAEWRDRADAAIEGIDKVDLRDLRTVLVAAEDYARDAESRELAERIREGLNERVERSQNEWHDELRVTLREGRVVRALRLSSRPPKAGAPLPPDVAEDMTAQANAALGSGNSQHRLGIVLEAVAYSPIRPYVVLPNVPDEPTEELLEIVRKVAGRLPEVATALGIEPGKNAPRTRPRRKRPPKAAETEPTAEETTADEPTADEPKTEAADSVSEAAAPEDVASEEVIHSA